MNVKMRCVGYAGFQEEGRSVFLYQCPRCKTVIYSTEYEEYCPDCEKEGGK